MPARSDITNQTFGRLTAIEDAGKSKNGKRLWKCACECGKSIESTVQNLKNGNTTSCGCLQKELVAARSKTHGKRKHPLFGVWTGMRQRCSYPKHKSYEYYGGRGITVCAEWDNSFQAFYDWAIAAGYRKGLSIDRIDNDGPYAPDNCRWANRYEQLGNTRDNLILTYRGKTQNAAQWARELGLPHSRIWRRKKQGWSDEDALTLPRYTRP